MRLRGRKVKGPEWDVVTVMWVVAVGVIGTGGAAGLAHYAVSGPEYFDTVSSGAETSYRLHLHKLISSTWF